MLSLTISCALMAKYWDELISYRPASVSVLAFWEGGCKMEASY